MKTKTQKRIEAIERLEREPSWPATTPTPTWIKETSERRRAEAERLRVKFGH